MPKPIQTGWSYRKTVGTVKTGLKKGVAHFSKVTKLMRGGRMYHKKTSYYQEVEMDETGAIVSYGKLVMDKAHPTVTKNIPLMHNGDDRLDTGFDTLMNEFTTKGISPERAKRMIEKWDMMSPTEKADVYDIYRETNNEKMFGSSSLDERAPMSRGDPIEYANEFERAMNRVMGIENEPDIA